MSQRGRDIKVLILRVLTEEVGRSMDEALGNVWQ